MKKLIIILTIALFAINSFGQDVAAKKPTIMVVPSDRYCIAKGYSMTFDNQGTQVTLPDYKKALQTDGDLRLVISKMSGLMADRGFPLKDLEQELKSLAQESAEMSMMTSKTGNAIAESPIDALKRTAKADIIMDLDFEVKRQGPQKYITFVLNGLDAYTNKNVASAAGSGKPSTAASADLLLEEAVLSYMDEFNGRLMAFFQDMFEKGREVKIQIKVFDGNDVDLESEFTYNDEDLELGEIIENWMADNTVAQRYSLSDGTENFQKYEQVRIPMYYTSGGKQRAMDTKRFVGDLSKFLKKEPFLLDSKVYLRGLGEAWLIVGEK